MGSKSSVSSRHHSLSSYEIMFAALFAILVVLCAGLIAVSWLTIKESQRGAALGQSHEARGTFKITSGVTYNPNLQDKLSVDFKVLAFDLQQMIDEIFLSSNLKNEYKNSRVLQFENGSIVVTFDLFFAQWVSDENVKEELIQGVEANKSSQLATFHIDLNSVDILGKLTTTSHLATPGNVSTECPPGSSPCADALTCIKADLFCDGEVNCPDGSDEDNKMCATVCDGRFLLTGSSGSFQATHYPKPSESSVVCQWIIRVNQGLSIKLSFDHFNIYYTDTLNIYEGVGSSKILRASIWETNPGTIRIFSNQVTATFLIESDESDYVGFDVTYTAFNSSELNNYEKINCNFEDGFCFWVQDLNDDNEWERIQGSTFPPFTGPNFDHTFGNASADCGGPFELWEPNTTFSSMNFPNSYPNLAFSVYTGPGPVKDVFSTTNRMTVLLITNDVSARGGFKANFTTGYHLGIPEPCKEDNFQCKNGECVPLANLCDGDLHCEDGSDEADCVRLFNGTTNNNGLVQFRIQSLWHTACAENWTTQISNDVCQLLGLGSGNSSMPIFSTNGGPFVKLNTAPDGSLILTP
ncbi:hypothetical protein H8959_007067, partial [Pygathrix nigripes]